MGLIVYLDETGDHTLEIVDKEYPIFAVVLFICDEEVYINDIAPTVYRLKFDYFSHEGVILHSRDIRKAQNHFQFLTDPKKRGPFEERINTIMRDSDYTLIAGVIQKQIHKELYGVWARNPYDLAMKFAMERLLPLLEEVGQTQIQILAESRGRSENDALRLSFYRIVNYGTEFIDGERFKKVQFRLNFRKKKMNIIGTQLADLAAYPTARHVLNPKKPNALWEIIEEKFYEGPGNVRGLKVFP